MDPVSYHVHNSQNYGIASNQISLNDKDWHAPRAKFAICGFPVSRSTLSALRRKRAEFHGAGRFTRYRYPAKFHHQPITSGGSVRTPGPSSFLPASLRTVTRYGQEPTVQSRGQRTGRVPGLTSGNRRRKRTMVDHACQCSIQVIQLKCF